MHVPRPDSAPRSPRSQPLPHAGVCGPRIVCHRPECLAAYPGLATVEIVAGHYLARCHGLTHDALGWRADAFAHGFESSGIAA
jgi:hypothetical protein